MSNNPIFVGYEASMGYVKSYSNVTEEFDTYRNTLTEITESMYEDHINGNTDGFEDPTKQVYKVEFQLREPMYFRIGQDVTSQDTDGFNYNSKEKYSKQKWLAANFIAIYRQVSKEDITPATPIYIATGLPTNHSVDKKLRESIKENLKQVVTVNGKSLRVFDAAVVPQGDASFFNDLFTLEGEVNSDFIEETTPKIKNQQSILLYFDIGFVTTDIKTVKDYSMSFESIQLSGMEQNFDKILGYLEEKNVNLYGINVLAVEEQLREGGEIEFDYEEADLTDERNLVLSKFAQQLIDTVDKNPFDQMLVTQVRFVGGGAIVMEEYIKEYLKDKFESNPKKAERFKFLKDIKESPFTNCLGFYKVCVKKFSN